MVQDGQSLACSIASASIAHYDTLPKHGKPQLRSNGVPEWTILATICLIEPRDLTRPNEDLCLDNDHPGASIRVISLGTGVKCLPANKLPPCGDTIHDSHAEVLARRGFVRWLIQQAKEVATGGSNDGVLLLDGAGRFKLRPGVQIWLYVSTLPCGDASTLHTAAHQPADMAALKNSAEGQKPIHSIGTAIRGRNGYEAFGAIRTKPGRADSVPSISFSCSDKIASWSVLGLQGALLARYFDPVFLNGVVVGGIEDPPESWPSSGDWRDTIRGEVERAVHGRLEGIADHVEASHTLHPPSVHITSVPFPFAKDQVVASSGRAPVPAVTSLLHLPSLSTSEVLFNGCKAATWKTPGHDALAEKHRSAVCKLEIMRAVLGLRDVLVSQAESGLYSPETYYDLKHSTHGQAYQRAKAVLRGIISGDTSLDSAFGNTGPFQITAGPAGGAAPFTGWIVSGQKYESFTREGVLMTRIADA